MRHLALCGIWSKQAAGGLLGCTLLLSSPMGARAWGGSNVGGAKHDRLREVERLEQAWRSAELAGDAAALDRMLAEDYVGVTVMGKVHTKAQQLRRIRERLLVFSQLDLSDVKFRLSGDVAVITGRAKVLGSSAGKPLNGRYSYTQVMHEGKDGTWTITNFEARQIFERKLALLGVAGHSG